MLTPDRRAAPPETGRGFFGFARRALPFFSIRQKQGPKRRWTSAAVRRNLFDVHTYEGCDKQ
ncbi:MAG TPA: hypothetical protein PKD48_12280, partial [Sphingopyxis sp.]|nr:hypothetical protein [Sphingopyxis sp.]